ncbi:hypothetical protein [Stratiformator vulcanicus]|uniref:Restriction endonuclease type IV Mrr domain-containing protein n=1 Tax=Stratiformator vulcanicus TaxID=2527980 RepID=A0A517R773_9PLAN|nr:hypothetical protein [Stratiformator vulcanicus]QDT39747.1 hypothetical protein Pan189_41560 [Stratiformator vulcanicus]
MSDVDWLADEIRRHRVRFGTEREMQDDIERLLRSLLITFERESETGVGPIDFRVGRIGIECKVAGGPAAVLRQLMRYADVTDLGAIVLVTSRHTHRFTMQQLRGKPFRVVWVAGVF